MTSAVAAAGLGSTLLLSAVLCAALLSGPAQAQPGTSAAAPAPVAGTLTVTAPRVVRGDSGSVGLRGTPIEVVSLSRTVSFADLDLTTDTGADEFRKRILYGALAACDELDAKYPSNLYVPAPDQNCPDATARPAMAVGEEIIATARHGAR
jgi:UrcA family protein